MDEPISRWLAVARGVHLAACMLILGVWIFDRWIIAGTQPTIAQPSRRISGWLLAIALPAALLSGIAWLYLVADGMRDPDQPMRFSVLRVVWTTTQFGRVWQIRMILWIAFVLLSPPLVLRGRVREGVRRPYQEPPPLSSPGVPGEGENLRAVDWLAGAIGAAFVASLAWAGHGATGPAPNWHRAADAVHLLVCAAWPMGVIPLGLLLWQRRPFPAAILRRFSAMALCAVAVLIGTGIVNSWCLVGSFPALWNTAYGRVLLVKLAIFLMVIPLGASNLLRDKSRPPGRRLIWIVTIEAVLGLGIMAIVGVLGLLMPARM